jgi:GNAT superfamily N-acetyltransferase
VATLAGVADVREVHLDDSRWFANPDGFAAVLGSAQRFAVIYVTPSARRRKIGTQLWAQIEQQYPDALLLALPGERGIKSLGEAVGMTARFIAMGGK